MIKIKMLKDTEKCKAGEIVSSTKENAESTISQGYAEYVTENKSKKKELSPKDKKGFAKAYKILEKEGAIEKKGKEEVKYKEINLPCDNRLVSVWADEIGKEFEDKDMLFRREELNSVFQIRKIEEKETFIELNPTKFITDIEKIIIPVVKRYNSETKETYIREKSISSQLANTTMQSDVFQNHIPIVKRIYNFPMPIEHEGEITFPKVGYDSRFKCWLSSDSPKIIKPDMELKEAKEIIESLFIEFPFKEEIYRTNAISALITPFLRGIFPRANNRTPIFIIEANRERAGKDYLMGIIQIVYDGYANEDPPISTGQHNSNNNEELRKKIISCLMEGRRSLHFANNKGFLNNSILESLITTPNFSDRILGKNEMVNFRNELDLSLSGNTGITFTADIVNRSRPIRLFLDIENANERKFDNPNLHSWVLKNRGLILSALYCLIRNWIDKEKPKGNGKFASFPEWADVCGGIMESAGYESPCEPDTENSIGGDTETQEMKSLFEICFKEKPNQFLKRNEIIDLARKEDSDIFPYLDLSLKKDQTKFGIKLVKFTGRILSGIRMVIMNSKAKGSRKEFKFIGEIPNDP